MNNIFPNIIFSFSDWLMPNTPENNPFLANDPNTQQLPDTPQPSPENVPSELALEVPPADVSKKINPEHKTLIKRLPVIHGSELPSHLPFLTEEEVNFTDTFYAYLGREFSYKGLIYVKAPCIKDLWLNPETNAEIRGPDIFKKTITNILEEAKKRKAKSIVFPALGGESYRFPADLTEKIYKECLTEFFDKNRDYAIKINFIIRKKDHDLPRFNRIVKEMAAKYPEKISLFEGEIVPFYSVEIHKKTSAPKDDKKDVTKTLVFKPTDLENVYKNNILEVFQTYPDSDIKINFTVRTTDISRNKIDNIVKELEERYPNEVLVTVGETKETSADICVVPRSSTLSTALDTWHGNKKTQLDVKYASFNLFGPTCLTKIIRYAYEFDFNSIGTLMKTCKAINLTCLGIKCITNRIEKITNLISNVTNNSQFLKDCEMNIITQNLKLIESEKKPEIEGKPQKRVIINREQQANHQLIPSAACASKKTNAERKKTNEVDPLEAQKVMLRKRLDATQNVKYDYSKLVKEFSNERTENGLSMLFEELYADTSANPNFKKFLDERNSIGFKYGLLDIDHKYNKINVDLFRLADCLVGNDFKTRFINGDFTNLRRNAESFRYYYQPDMITQEQIKDSFTKVPVAATDGDKIIIAQNGDRVLGPDLLNDLERRRSRTAGVSIVTSTATKIGGFPRHVASKNQEHTDFTLVDTAGFQFEKEGKLEGADFLVKENAIQLDKPLFPQYYSKGIIPSYDEIKAANEYKTYSAKNGIVETDIVQLKNGTFFLRAAFQKAMDDYLGKLVLPGVKDFLKDDPRAMYIKATGIGTGFFAKLSDYFAMGKANPNLDLGPFVQKTLLNTWETLITNGQIPAGTAIEFPFYSGDAPDSLQQAAAAAGVQIIWAPRRDILDFSPTESVANTAIDPKQYAIVVLNAGDAFPFTGNEKDSNSLEAGIANNTDIRFTCNYHFNPNVLNPEYHIPLRK